MRRLGGLVLFLVLTGCGAAAQAPVRVVAVAPVETTTTSPPASSTTIRVTPASVPPSTTVATTHVTVATPRVPSSVPPATSVVTTQVTVATTRAPVSTTARSTATVPTVGAGCDPNYAGACIPRGPDVDCGDIAAKRFRVVGTDVHRLDADGDGIACES